MGLLSPNLSPSIGSALVTKSQVATKQSELVTATEMLHQAIDTLSSRLIESVLRHEPDPVPAESINTGPVLVLVALASFLDVRVAQIKLATDRINSIINRLEV